VELILKEIPFIKVTGKVSNGQEALRYLNGHKTDLVMMDINMPVMNGVEALREIKKSFPLVKVIILSMHNEQQTIINVMKEGADGYLLKSADKAEFKTALELVKTGKQYFSNEITKTLMQQHTREDKVNGSEKLSSREIEIIKEVAAGYSNNEIADRLNISVRTVETHRKNIMAKLELKNMAALIRFAIQQNYI
ncbi:MAG: response regulator transcription factor, partial [Sediminibacterium sp.]|nr:response regulator transcription factor [Sediminibacterium sp.]